MLNFILKFSLFGFFSCALAVTNQAQTLLPNTEAIQQKVRTQKAKQNLLVAGKSRIEVRQIENPSDTIFQGENILDTIPNQKLIKRRAKQNPPQKKSVPEQ